MASSFYPTIFRQIVQKKIDLDPVDGGTADTVKVLLLNNTYTFDATDEFVSDLSGELADGVNSVAGYSRKTVPVGISLDLSPTAPDTEGVFINLTMTDNAKWTNASFICRHAVVYVQKNANDDSVNPLLYYFDLTDDQRVSSGTFELKDASPQPKIRRV